MVRRVYSFVATVQDSGCCSLLQVLGKVTNGVPLAGSLIVAVTKMHIVGSLSNYVVC